MTSEIFPEYFFWDFLSSQINNGRLAQCIKHLLDFGRFVINCLIYHARNLPRTGKGTNEFQTPQKDTHAHGVGPIVRQGRGKTMKRTDDELWKLAEAGMVVCDSCGTAVPAKFGEYVGGRWVCRNCMNAECIILVNATGAVC